MARPSHRRVALKPAAGQLRIPSLAACAVVATVIAGCSPVGRPAPTPAPAPELVIVTVTPGPPPGQEPARPETVYVVQEGDTLSGIASKFSVGEEELMAANGISDPNRLFAGQELRVPATGNP